MDGPIETNMQQLLLKVKDLANILLTYLSFDVFKNPCTHEFRLQERVQSHKLAGYAARWWPEYVRGPGEINSELKGLLFNIFNSRSHVESILQLETLDLELPTEVTLLHFTAFHQMTTVCGLICSRAAQRDFGNNSSHGALAVENSREQELGSGLLGTVYSRDGFQETPLHVAARKGYADIATILLRVGSDVNVKS